MKHSNYLPADTTHHFFEDITGQTFGRLTAIRLLGKLHKRSKVHWLCRCECGEETHVAKSKLKSGQTVSCGCEKRQLAKERLTTHGLRQSAEYSVWCGVKRRCCNPNDRTYKFYGQRGIKICARWLLSFENFLTDMGPRPGSEYSIERNDSDGDYSPDNCRWATKVEQANNTRSNVLIEYEGCIYTMVQLTRKLGLDYHGFKYRYQVQKLPLEEAIAKATKL